MIAAAQKAGVVLQAGFFATRGWEAQRQDHHW